MLDVVPPPELHLLMGAVNSKLELLRMILETMGMEQKLWDWCDSKGVTRQGENIVTLYPLLIPGYNGKNKLDGNNASRFLKKVEDLKMCEWFPSQTIPIVGVLLTFKDVKDTCFGWELGEGWESAITAYSNMFGELQQYAILDLGMEI